MRTIYAVALTAAASLGLAATYNASHAVPASNPTTPALVGRYQFHLTPAGSEFLVDTVTGDVWYRGAGNAPWRKDGNPAKGENQGE